MRVAVALVVVVVGCGRSGFDEIGLTVEPTDSRIVVSAPGRFRLVFDRAFDWQPVGWFDLASGPERDLVDGPEVEPSRHLLQGLLVLSSGMWLRMSMGSGPAIAIEQLDRDHVRAFTSWRWVAPSRMLDASVVHLIASDGTWILDASVSDATGDATPLEGLEYADAHVTEDLVWQVTAIEPSYEFVAQGLDPAPAIRVTRTIPLGTLASDEPNNRYWAVGSTPLPASLSWTVSIWRP